MGTTTFDMTPSPTRRSDDLAGHAALLLRLALGTVFIAHALAKLLVYTLPGTAQFFVAHDLPGWAATPVFLAELVGGVLLVLGVATRVVAVALLPIIAGAFTVHWANGWSFDANGGGWEYVAFLGVALLVQAALGPGTASLGSIRRRRQ